ncbi:MAG: succinyl-diaminopimelate desuccinylase [Pikeienuella sp.]
MTEKSDAPEIDPVALTKELIRCPSVTPEEGGALSLLEEILRGAGFVCHRIRRGGIDNLYARWGTEAPVFGFAGHTDVVPPGDVASWAADPFGGTEADGQIWGRGAADMKSGVAAFVAAAVALVSLAPPEGSVALLITGDEEGVAKDGTLAILDWMTAAGERLDFCLVGEPTSFARLGDVVKIGRRGSMSAELTVFGSQGHTAYPERAVNPLPVLAAVCDRLATTPLDMGSTHFQASTLALTSLEAVNPATNVIPAEGRARFNIRFNDLHSSESVKIWTDQQIEEVLKGTGCTAEIDWKVSGESFLTPPGPLSDIVLDAITDRLLERPALTTGGGTSDARFIRAHCPVLEFGLVGDTMHQIDERVPVADIRGLARLYRDILDRFFGA